MLRWFAHRSWAPNLFRGSDIAAQKCNREHQNKNEDHEHAKLEHRRMEDTLAIELPIARSGKPGHLQADHKYAPDRSNQAHNQEGFGGEHDMRTHRNADV